MKPVFTPIDYPQFLADVRALTDAIGGDYDWSPSFLIGIGRGGLVPAVYLSHATGIPTLSCDLSSAVKEFSEDVLARLAERTRAGEHLLFVDDINDSGRTIGTLRRALAGYGAPADSVRIATLLDNIVSSERVDYAARTIDRTSTKDWFIFPWESVAPTASQELDAAAVPERIA